MAAKTELKVPKVFFVPFEEWDKSPQSEILLEPKKYDNPFSRRSQ
jgi:hypothetical protein